MKISYLYINYKDMKFLLYALILLALPCVAQTVADTSFVNVVMNRENTFIPKIDTLLFNRINKYRSENNLRKITWDSIASKESKHHNIYLKNRCVKKCVIVIGHGEDSSLFEHPSNRYVYYGGKDENWSGEIIAYYFTNTKDDGKVLYDKIAYELLDEWKKSPAHNKIILTPDQKAGGCNVLILMKPNIMGYTFYYVMATFCFSR